METILYFTGVIILLYLIIESILKYGWIDLWNTFFIAVLIITLVITQKYMGKIEGSLISLVPFVTAQLLIKYNNNVQKFYLLRQSRFVSWCNKYLYDFSSKEKKKKP